MTNSIRNIAVLMVAVAVPLEISLSSAQASPGADVPWITYEAESMTNNGTILGPSYAANTVQTESSGRKCVKLSATGQYVEFTAQAAANAIVVRYSVPDSADGVGVDSTISLYTNGVFAQKLPVTSKYSWLYGAFPFTNSPAAGSPRNFYDEVRLKGLVIAAGDGVRLQKDATDTATYDTIDLVELENIAPPLVQPAGSWLSITAYGAVADDSNDDTTAFQNCVNAARSQGKSVWVPAGAYILSADINNLQNLTIQGAGMWHTLFVGDPAVYPTASRRVRFNGGGNNLHFADFAIIGKLNYRNDSEVNDGFNERYGTGSTIARIWVEHTKTGAWIINSSGLIVSGCRFRDTIADGINLAVGMRSVTVTNCTARGTGDDCFAVWPATYTTQTYKPGLNVITHCTGQLPFLANGGALYGGESNRIEDCLFQDMPYGCGVLLSGTFPVGTNTFSGTTVVQRTDLYRCGGNDPGYGWRAALQFTMENQPITNAALNDLNIVDSASDGLSIFATNTLANTTVSNLYLPNYGKGVSGRHGLWAKSDAHGSMTVNNSAVVESRDDSPNFAFTFNNPVKQVSGSVELQSFAGTNRMVRFVLSAVSGGITNYLQTNDVTLTFSNGRSTYNLMVPTNSTHISAKTAWHLRRRQTATFAGVTATVDFTDSAILKGGDLLTVSGGTITDTDNAVTSSDYLLLLGNYLQPVGSNAAIARADIDGDGAITSSDYLVLLGNYLTSGDAP